MPASVPLSVFLVTGVVVAAGGRWLPVPRQEKLEAPLPADPGKLARSCSVNVQIGRNSLKNCDMTVRFVSEDGPLVVRKTWF